MAAVPLIVSLWGGPDKQRLLCSGVLLSPRHILTVRHAFASWPDGAAVYVRLIDGVDGDVTARVFQRHPERDAALLLLDTAVGLAAAPRLLTQSVQSLDGQTVTLRVVDPQSHGRSSPSNYSIANFDHAAGEYVITPEDAKGHSGGVVEADGQVIGLLSRRRQAAPLCRAVAVHLLWPWIEAAIGPLPTPAAPPPAAPAGVLAPAYRALAEKVRDRVARRLHAKAHLGPLAAAWGADPLAGFDPAAPPADLVAEIKALLFGLYRATADCLPGWAGLSAAGARRELRDDCRFILSELIRLTVDPAAGAADLAAVAAAAPDRFHLACRFGGTGDVVFCALADLPHLLSRREPRHGVAASNSVHLDDLLPSGQGADLRQEVLKKLWCDSMADPLPGRIEDKDYRLLMARMGRLRGRDGRRYLLAGPGEAAWCGAGQYRDLADELHLGLVLHEDGDCPHLLFDEADLIDAVREYLELLETL